MTRLDHTTSTVLLDTANNFDEIQEISDADDI